MMVKEAIVKTVLGVFFLINASGAAEASARLADSVKALKKGDLVPDIPLGDLKDINNQQIYVADYRGKLIVLDFWTTGCTASCIDAFPNMMKLQQEFGDRIKIILINAWESRDQIVDRLGKMRSKKYFEILKATNLVVAGAHEFKELFPEIRFVPHHVWIGKDQRVIGSGAPENTNAFKITQYLKGKEVFFMNNANSSTIYNPAIPYGNQIDDESTPLEIGFLITPFNNSLAAGRSGAKARRIVDSIDGTVRDTYINYDILALFSETYPDSALNPGLNIAYSKNKTVYEWADFFIFPPGFDTLSVTTVFKNPLLVNDRDIIRSKYCYEQITPLEWPDHKRSEFMLSNLNRFFSKQIGITCTVEQQAADVYILKRTSLVDKVSSEKGGSVYSREVKDTIVAGNRMKKYISWGLSSKGGNIFTSSLFGGNFQLEDARFILDETGLETNFQSENVYDRYRVDMILPHPKDINDIGDFRDALRTYDLALEKVKRKVKLFVVRSVK